LNNLKPMELNKQNQCKEKTAKQILEDIKDIYAEKFEEYDMQETEEMFNDITSYINKQYLFINN